MPAGTIALTNNSTAVVGTGTSFTSELKTGDFVYANVGSAPFTLVVASISSDTQLTLAIAFDGPTTSGLSWNAVPASVQVAITQKILNDFASVARGRILDFQNWQKIYSDEQSVTVTRPDRTQFTGPSWGYMSAQYANKANLVNDVVEVAHGGTGQKTLSGVMTWLGLGDAAFKNTGTTSGTLAAGNDPRLTTVNGKTGGRVSSALIAPGISSDAPAAATTQGTYIGWNEYNDGGSTIQCNRGGGNGGFTFRVVNNTNTSEIALFRLAYNGIGYAPGGWITGSDERIKEDIQEIDPEFALDAVLNLRHVKFKMRDRPDGDGGWAEGERSVGYLAADLEKYLPDAVTTQIQRDEFAYRCRGDNDEIVTVNDLKSIDPGKAAAALNGSAIKALYSRIEKQDAIIEELQKRMKAIDGLDA